jgi:hypothetical protein
MLRVFVLALLLAGPTASPEPCIAEAGPCLSVVIDVREDAEVVLDLEVDDRTPAEADLAVTAAAVFVDGVPDQEILMFPGAGRDRYDAVLGPLGPGRHVVELRPSRFWPPDPRLSWRELRTRVLTAADPAYDALRFAPRLELRADTVGEASDLPLLVYVEEAGGRLTYTVVFSNEDAGTPARTLMARWGRAVDIEMAYSVERADGRVVRETYQGLDHELRPFRGRRQGAHPVLLVATLNNVFLDRGRGAVVVCPAPVHHGDATRESVMDTRPFIQEVLTRELAHEGKLTPGRGVKPDQVVLDPRRYLYFEARLRLEHAAVAARAVTAHGAAASHGGDARLAITRDGWVRTAVALPPGRVGLRELGWECLGERKRARCHVEATRVFGLDASFLPGPNLVVPASFDLAGGETGRLQRVEGDPEVLVPHAEAEPAVEVDVQLARLPVVRGVAEVDADAALTGGAGRTLDALGTVWALGPLEAWPSRLAALTAGPGLARRPRLAPREAELEHALHGIEPAGGGLAAAHAHHADGPDW